MILILLLAALLQGAESVSNKIKHKAPNLIYGDMQLPQSEENPFDLEYPPGNELTSKEICINLREILISFSNDATNYFENCDESIHLLGMGTEVMDKVKPDCYLTPAEAFCAYDIVFINETFPYELRDLIFTTMTGCLGGKQLSDSAYYKCPGLNLNTNLVEDEELLCENLESKLSDVREYKGLVDREELDVENRNSREYSFVKKEYKNRCKYIVAIYNLCISIFNTLMPQKDISLCLKHGFLPYGGSYIKKYNKENADKCRNYVFPYFVYKSRLIDLTNPRQEYFCDNIQFEIKKTLNEKIEKIDSEKKELTAKHETLLKELGVVQETKNKTMSLVKYVIFAKKSWAECYGDIKTFQDNKKRANIMIFKNMEILKDSFESIVQVGRSSSDFSTSPIFRAGRINSLIDSIHTQMKKINTTLKNMENVCSTLRTLTSEIYKPVKARDEEEDKLLQEQLDKDSAMIIDLKNSDVEDLHNRFVDAKTEYEQFLTELQKKVEAERVEYIKENVRMFEQFDRLNQKKEYLIAQKEAGSVYNT